MDILASIFTAERIALAIISIVGLVSLAAALRLLFKGRNTYAEHHEAMEKRIRATAADIDTCNKSISSKEHLYILTAALTEGISLWGDPATMHVQTTNNHIILSLPQGQLRIDYTAQAKTLRSIQKTLYSNEQWKVQGPEENTQAFFEDIASVEEYITSLIHGDKGNEQTNTHSKRNTCKNLT